MAETPGRFRRVREHWCLCHLLPFSTQMGLLSEQPSPKSLLTQRIHNTFWPPSLVLSWVQPSPLRRQYSSRSMEATHGDQPTLITASLPITAPTSFMNPCRKPSTAPFKGVVFTG